jgi:hypothetical protein
MLDITVFFVVGSEGSVIMRRELKRSWKQVKDGMRAVVGVTLVGGGGGVKNTSQNQRIFIFLVFNLTGGNKKKNYSM